jgi:hypothetical protein
MPVIGRTLDGTSVLRATPVWSVKLKPSGVVSTVVSDRVSLSVPTVMTAFTVALLTALLVIRSWTYWPSVIVEGAVLNPGPPAQVALPQMR